MGLQRAAFTFCFWKQEVYLWGWDSADPDASPSWKKKVPCPVNGIFKEYTNGVKVLRKVIESLAQYTHWATTPSDHPSNDEESDASCPKPVLMITARGISPLVVQNIGLYLPQWSERQFCKASGDKISGADDWEVIAKNCPADYVLRWISAGESQNPGDMYSASRTESEKDWCVEEIEIHNEEYESNRDVSSL